MSAGQHDEDAPITDPFRGSYAWVRLLGGANLSGPWWAWKHDGQWVFVRQDGLMVPFHAVEWAVRKDPLERQAAAAVDLRGAGESLP